MEIRDQAIDFIKSLSKSDREKLKEMQARNILCGAGYAEQIGVNAYEFNAEIKAVLDGIY